MKKTILTILLTVIITLFPFPAFAQEGAAPVASFTGLEKPVVSEEYVLMPGDSILITVTGSTNYSYVSCVTFEGKTTINLPVTSMMTPQGIYMPKYDVVATLPVYDLTLKAARDSLTKAFLHYYRNIVVDVTLLAMRKFIVFVVGEVKNPGSIQALPIERVADVVGRVGGTTTLGSRSQIQLRRNGEALRKVDLEDFEMNGNLSVNPYVQDGDIIYVPKMAKSVIVKGAVFGKRGYELKVSQLTAAMERTSEGLYELRDGDRVVDIMAKAGGITPWADLKNVYVERNKKRLALNMLDTLARDSLTANLPMQDGDVLVIPSVNAAVYVQGQIVNPSSYPYQPNLRASDYIGLAGGPLDDANMAAAYVVRDKKRISIRKDPIIEQGDRVFVPRQVFKFWQDYVEIASVAATLLISYLTFQSLNK